MSVNVNRSIMLAALLLAAPVLAGCIGSAQATAMEEQDTAEDLAQDWDDDVQLVSIVGLEGNFPGGAWAGMGDWDWDWDWDWDHARPGPSADAQASYTVQQSSAGSGDYWERAADDDDVGDGKCELWAYRFISPNKPGQAYVVVVDRDGELVHQGIEDKDGDDVPLGAWEIDSDEAADIALDANEGLRQGTSSEHYGIILVLGHDEDRGNAVWFIAGGGGDSSGGGGGMVILDGVTGEVYESQGGFGRA